jgi:hypothetical protein
LYIKLRVWGLNHYNGVRVGMHAAALSGVVDFVGGLGVGVGCGGHRGTQDRDVLLWLAVTCC